MNGNLKTRIHKRDPGKLNKTPPLATTLKTVFSQRQKKDVVGRDQLRELSPVNKGKVVMQNESGYAE